jgi:cytidylate kinase
VINRWLGFDYLSASELMLNQMSIPPDRNNALWATRMSDIEARRDSEPVDELVNKLLIEALRTRDATVFDSWSAPWLPSAESCLRIWIESTPESRAMKVRVSQEPYGPFLTLPECEGLMAAKDTATIRRFEPLLGVDISVDRTPFDLVVDNSQLIVTSTIDSARSGISTFHTELVALLTECLPAGVAQAGAR